MKNTDTNTIVFPLLAITWINIADLEIVINYVTKSLRSKGHLET